MKRKGKRKIQRKRQTDMKDHRKCKIEPHEQHRHKVGLPGLTTKSITSTKSGLPESIRRIQLQILSCPNYFAGSIELNGMCVFVISAGGFRDKGSIRWSVW